jgi:hypothetical protein
MVDMPKRIPGKALEDAKESNEVMEFVLTMDYDDLVHMVESEVGNEGEGSVHDARR